MDKTLIIGGGVALGLLMLIMSSRSASASTAKPDIVGQTYAAQANNVAAAPALIDAVTSYQSAHEQNVAQIQNQHEQNLLNYAAQAGELMARQGQQTLAFSATETGQMYSNLADKRQHETDMYRAKTERVAVKGQIDLQKQAQDNAFMGQMIGGITSGLNPGQTLYGGGSGQYGGVNPNGGSQLTGIIQSVLGMLGGGGSGGGLLSGLGGGTGGGGGSSGGSGLSSLASIAALFL